MTTATALHGLGVAVATPFDASGRVDYKAFGTLLEFLAVGGAGRSDTLRALPTVPAKTPAEFRSNESGGCDFLVVLGSTG